MSKKVLIFVSVFFGILPAYGDQICSKNIDKYETIERSARISPDYNSTVIPPNIAPLNFMVKEEGSRYLVKIYSQNGEAFEVFSKSAKIQIPEGKWHKLLEKNKGNELHFDIFVKTNTHGWVRFGTITNKIAGEDIDGYLVYRRMPPFHYPVKSRIGIYQRNLAGFDEKLVLDSRRYNANCVNCHTFCLNQPNKVLMGVRLNNQGAKTLLIEDGVAGKIGAKFGYTTWHPSGKLAVYSINNLPVFFHTAGNDVIDTFDLNSALMYFVTDSKTIKTSPEISRKDRQETWPVWSADGQYLYFCSAPMMRLDQTKAPYEGYNKVKYDLVRISYDLANDKWGKVETVLSAADTGRSIAMPRTSPDGRWLMFCMCDYGYFPPWQKNSDLYLMDLKVAGQTDRYKYRHLEINSDKSEAGHSWSSNSRWVVFSSKRVHDLFTRSYISYVDESGKVYKPIVLPQKDPEFYESCLDAFNTPEFAVGPIAVIGEKLARVMHSDNQISVDTPFTMATPKTEKNQDWQEAQ